MQLDDRVVLVDKDPGLTSFAVVRRLRRLGRLQKAGHCGSLDPLATGLLLVCTGVGTRITSVFMELPKEYQARVRFGRSTDTYDAEGRITQEGPVPPLGDETLRAALRTFEGEIEQKPPMHSAVKVGGKRLYELARAGQEVERVARPVMVHEITLVDRGAEHADIRVRCGKGCYVRSIAHELGEKLGVPAHLEALRRVASGPFRVEGAVKLAALEAVLAGTRAEDVARAGAGSEHDGKAAAHDRDPDLRARCARAVLTIPLALEVLPALHLRATFEARLLHGVQPAPGTLREAPRTEGLHRLMSEDGARLLALTRVHTGQGLARVELERVFDPPLAAVEMEPD
jgi:tRNA pseudouridine55 synthase